MAEQLRLIPPSGAIARPLPEDIRKEAAELLAELLTVILDEIVSSQPTQTGEEDE